MTEFHITKADIEFLDGQSGSEANNLRAEVERIRAENDELKAKHEAQIDLSNALEKMYRKEMAKAGALRKRISRIAAIAHTGGLVGLGEGGALNMVRALTILYMEKSDTRDQQITRLNEAMAAARDESKARQRTGDIQ